MKNIRGLSGPAVACLSSQLRNCMMASGGGGGGRGEG
jgi:hypothetical protein